VCLQDDHVGQQAVDQPSLVPLLAGDAAGAFGGGLYRLFRGDAFVVPIGKPVFGDPFDE
jgi:hypothetical protein